MPTATAHRVHSLGDAFAEIAALVPVSFLDRLMGAGGGAGGDGGAAHAAVFEEDFDLDRGVSAAVEDLAGVDVENRGHLLRPRSDL